MERDVGEIGEDNLSFSIKLKEDCDTLKARNGTRQAQEQHETNELHRFCRDIESLASAGYDVQRAYRIVKEKYRK